MLPTITLLDLSSLREGHREATAREASPKGEREAWPWATKQPPPPTIGTASAQPVQATAAKPPSSFVVYSTPVATGATVYNIEIDLADADRQVYESLSLRVARHPSESGEYLVTRVLAYTLEFAEGIAFSTGGLSDPDEPAVTIRDLTGVVTSWIEIGSPDAARLHKASKAAPRVVVYTHKDVERLASRLLGERIHRIEDLELYAFTPALVAALTKRLDRRMAFALTVSERELFVSIGTETLTGRVERRPLA